MPALFSAFLRDRVLHILILAGAILLPLADFRWAELPAVIDWRTIMTLCGLLLLTRGIEISGYFDVLGARLIRRFRHQRALAWFMVLAAALLSTFLTNDVALFILVPLTLGLGKFSSLPVGRLIIFEALAVNAGSLLTPVGNPQNILLWGRSGLSFWHFSVQMAPLALLLIISLLLLTTLAFSRQPLSADRTDRRTPWQPRLLLLSGGLYLLFLLALEWQQVGWALLAIMLCFLLLARRVLLSIDWSLLAVFIIMFIDVFLLTRLPLLQEPIARIAALSDGQLYLLAIGLSQIISNVPATILLLQQLPPSSVMAWAVNIGGFGLLPGSLANLIALRMAQDRRIWWHFHLFSVPMLFWAMAAGWGLLTLSALFGTR